MNKKHAPATLSFLLTVVFLLAGHVRCEAQPASPAPAHSSERSGQLPLSIRDYTFGYWLNGLRKHKEDGSRDILCIETGHYGLSLDVAELSKARFGLFEQPLDYSAALVAGDARMRSLAAADLKIEIENDGKTYRAVRSKAAMERLHERKMLSARLWESARYAQHFDLLGLEFVDDNGVKLVSDAKLDLVAWPDSWVINAEIEPVVPLVDGPQQGVRGKGHGVKDQSLLIAHHPGLEHEQFTLETWIMVPKESIHKNRGWIVSKNRNGAQAGFFGIEIHGDKILGTINIDGGGWAKRITIETPRHTIGPDRWHHLALTYDGASLAIYVDGIQRDFVEINKKRIPGNGEMRIGRLADNSGKSVNLSVDQVRMWNRALSVHELRIHGRNAADLGKREGLTYVNDFEHGPELKLPVWNDAKMRISFKSGNHHWQTEQTVAGSWTVGEKNSISLNCEPVQKGGQEPTLSVVMKHNGELPVTYRMDFNCFAASINRPKRHGKSGYTDIRDYDEIDITVRAGQKGTVPFMMEMFRIANITGVCPILCDETGKPTGIPVQLSKNWHDMTMGDYLRAYVLLPSVQGEKKYKLKFAYGFYGSLPSASHAQLSLVGYGGNGRWDQLAIGCWGETYCMDVDMSCTDVAVTDVRLLMTRAGETGPLWEWTDAGWGGDWLGLKDPSGHKLLVNGVKAAYLAHGPCLTDVQYNGKYGSQQEVAFNAAVRTLRTDDYARTFTRLDYTFAKPVAADGWLFKMGRTGGYLTPRIAYGNRDGLIKEHVVPKGLQRDQDFLGRTTLTGSGPWWISFPGAYHYNVNSRISGTGYRAMVIRSYKAVIGGTEYFNPAVKFPVYSVDGQGNAGLDFLLTPPVGITQFNPGDRVEMEVEWITLPRVAQDYYGPNQAFRDHLSAKPSSWETTFREARGNNLGISVEGGVLRNNYPVIVESTKPDVAVTIKGGVGYVPIRFEGLDSADGYKLYQVVDGKEAEFNQAVHGNDFWQTDYDAKSESFKITYNLPLDGQSESKWILRRGTVQHRPPAAAAPAGNTAITTP